MTQSPRLDRFQVCDLLGVSMPQFNQLQRNPTFPKPVHAERFAITWDRAAIVAFQRQLDDARQRGWKVPDALFPWPA